MLLDLRLNLQVQVDDMSTIDLNSNRYIHFT